MLRRWAFDLDAELMQQDEDLILHDWKFSGILLELAADPGCPKADYILNIWDDFTRHMTVHQIPSDLDAARHSLALAVRYADHDGVRRWGADQSARLQYVDGIGFTDRPTALFMADALLNGASRSCQIEILRESETTFIAQLSVPHGNHKEWLLIDKMTGRFRYSRYWPDGAVEPRWFESGR